jgi:hypothetical protein
VCVHMYEYQISFPPRLPLTFTLRPCLHFLGTLAAPVMTIGALGFLILSGGGLCSPLFSFHLYLPGYFLLEAKLDRVCL